MQALPLDSMPASGVAVKKPPANLCKEAVALREAAQAFGRQPEVPATGDPHDKAGNALNWKLLTAALHYAHVVLTERLGPAIERHKDDIGGASSNEDARFFDTRSSSFEDALAALKGRYASDIRDAGVEVRRKTDRSPPWPRKGAARV